MANTIDVVSYYCEWRRCWVSFDGNLEPDECGDWLHDIGEGATQQESVDDLYSRLS